MRKSPNMKICHSRCRNHLDGYYVAISEKYHHQKPSKVKKPFLELTLSQYLGFFFAYPER